MSKLIDLNREYMTRDGREVELWKIVDNYVFGRMRTCDRKSWLGFDWKLDGTGSNRGSDLIPAPKKHKKTVWLVHYGGGAVTVYQSKESVDYIVTNPTDALAITGPHEIEFTEGEGLTP
jgi:hypothetical protein